MTTGQLGEMILPAPGGRYKDRERSMLNTIAICPEW
jgi:hypothetical protein